MISLSHTWEFCQEKISTQEALSTPCALSPELWRAAVVLDRNFRRIADDGELENQAQLRDILGLIGSEGYAKRLAAGVNTPKEKLWLAALGLTDGDRSSGKNAKRPGKPSGLLQIDVDHLSDDEPTLFKAQERVMELPFVVASFLSPGRNGLKIVAAIKVADDLEQGKRLGVACSKAICDVLGVPGYRENASKKGSSFDKLPSEIKERYGEAHIDFSVANDPRKGCFVPVRDSHLAIRQEPEMTRWSDEDDDTVLAGWYLNGVFTPWQTQQKPQMPIKAPTRPNIEFLLEDDTLDRDEADFQKYVTAALNSAIADLETAGGGEHHAAAIAYGRTVAKYAAHISVEDWYAAGDAVIDGWSPAATNPDLEKKTIREMDSYAGSFDKTAWMAEHKAQKSAWRNQNGRKAEIIEGQYVDFMKEQPEHSKALSKDAVMALMVKSFRAHYRFTPNGDLVRLRDYCVLTQNEGSEARERKWQYTDESNKRKYVSFKEAIAIIGTSLGVLYAMPVKRPDLPAKFVGVCKPDILADHQREIINVSPGIPTLGLDLQKTATETAKEEAKIVCDFVVSRFIDHYNYNADEAPVVAAKEAAYYFKYVSQALLHPTKKWQCAIGMLSPETGTGKTTLCNTLPDLFAPGLCAEISPDQLEDDGARRWIWEKFEGALFVSFDDFKDQQKSFAASLRNKISSNTLTIESKGIKAKNVYNYSRIMISSNSEEFLKELNSGVGTERRYHLFSCRNVMRGDKSCDAAMKIINKYVDIRSCVNGITDAERDSIQAWRAAMILEMQERVREQEAIYGEFDMNKPLESAEFNNQMQKSREHSKVARTAGNIIASSDLTLSNDALYGRIREALHRPDYSAKMICEALRQTGWFDYKKKEGGRFWQFTELGKKEFIAFEDYDNDDESKEECKVLAFPTGESQPELDIFSEKDINTPGKEESECENNDDNEYGYDDDNDDEDGYDDNDDEKFAVDYSTVKSRNGLYGALSPDIEELDGDFLTWRV